MTRTCILGITFFIVIHFIGCGTSNPILATIGDEKITLNNFEENYAKNNGGFDTSAASSLEDRQRFLDLFIKFRLKVKEARARGLEKDSAVMSEMETYNTSVAQSYMIEKEVVEPGVRQMYERKKEDVHASHILFRLAPTAVPEDTLKAYDLAMNTIAQIPQVPFDTLAFKYSQDPSAKTNYGNLGFFSSGRMVPEFEDACYSLKPGEYTKTPIRSQFGYHVVKEHGRRPNPGSVHMSHILLRFNEGMTDTAAVRDTVWMIYNKLKKGASFAETAKKYSNDPKSAPNNGDIGFYDRDHLPPKVGDVFYALKIDSVSEPMQFNYGYHIFKLTEKKGLKSFAEMQKDLKDAYQQSRYDYEYKRYASGLKAKYKITIDSSAVSKLIASSDTTKIFGREEWKDTLTSETLRKTLIHSTGRPFTVNDFAEKMMTSNDFRGQAATPNTVWQFTNKLLDVVAVEEHARHAAERYPVLASLLSEYKDGILLYRVEQDEVWKKVMVNDSLLKEYYNVHKEEYRWPERVNFAEIFTTTDSAAKAAYRKVKHGADFLGAAKELTNRSGYREKKGVWGFQPFTFNELSRKASTMAVDSIAEPFRYPGESGWSIIKTLAKDSAHVKSFEDATPEVASGFQEAASKQREQDWVETLKRKYTVTVNKDVLSEAFKRKRVESQ
jgi:peptidyl-prolyl cis-trans isomerase SurA